MFLTLNHWWPQKWPDNSFPMYKNFFKKKLENVFTSYKLQASEQMGFVYNTTTKGDSKSCNFGGLGK